MAARKKPQASLDHTIDRIEQLRKRVAGARKDNRKNLAVYNAFEFDLVQRALELLHGTLTSGRALEQSDSR